MTRVAEVLTERWGRAECEAHFGERVPGFWTWAFGENGDGVCAAARRDPGGELRAAVAALRVPARCDSQPTELLQVVSASSGAQGLQNPGRFVELAEHFARTHGGAPTEGAPLFYGVPTRALWRLAKERLSAKVMRTQDVLRARLEDLRLPAVGGVAVEEVTRFPLEVERLKLRQAEHSALICRPDAESLDRRFAESPFGAYRIGLARRGGALVGYAVLQVSCAANGAMRGVIWDWCVPGGDALAGAALLDWLASRARDEGAEELCHVLPDTQPDWVALQQVGFRVFGSRLVVAVRHFPRQLTMRWLYHNWSYSLSDLVLDGSAELALEPGARP